MADERTEARNEMAEELEGFAGGPGVVASKSQTKGSIGGLIVFGLVGAVLGLVVALIFFGGAQAIVITVVCFAVAGATFGGVAGGFVAPRKKLAGTEADK